VPAIAPRPVFPAALAPGDLVAVVAPSSPIPDGELWRGLAWLRARYRLRLLPSILTRDGYLAGDDDRRRDELAGALLDDEVKAIVAARGGYGAMRIVNDLPWAAFARRPKWIVGFSDVTALHAMAWRAGVASIHGPNAAALGRAISPAVRMAWLTSVERLPGARAWTRLRVVHGGDAEGVLVGGNLALLHAMAAAGLLELPAGAILAIEDVSEAPYRVDRMLTSLLLGGHLARVSAIVVGGFEGCAPRADGRTVDEVIADRTRALGVPVLAAAPFGHAPHNEAFVLGARATVRGHEVTLHPPGS
jgi:muramoyltetrapeptide carboxypeptidase